MRGHMRTTEAQNNWSLVKLPYRARPVPVSAYMPILDHTPVGDRYMSLLLNAPDIASTAQPGQFVMLTAARPGENTPVLPCPMAIYAIDKARGRIEVLYGVVGIGTRRLQSFRPSESMFLVGPLGRGFELQGPKVHSILLVGRGIGTCSLTTVAQANAVAGVETIAVTSARNLGALIGVEHYRRCHAKAVYPVTDDMGNSSPHDLFNQLTSDWDSNPPDLILTCGSTRLTRLCEELSRRWASPLQVSIEAHMACGLGYCHGCASGARSEGNESPLVCHDGPVFSWEELVSDRLRNDPADKALAHRCGS